MVSPWILIWGCSTALAGWTVVGEPEVGFHATGSPGFLTIEAEGKTLTLSEDDGALRFTVPMNTVKTGIELRDSHMRDTYVEVASFPEVAITLDPAAVAWPSADQKKSKGEVDGSFEAHGVSMPVRISYTAKWTSDGVRIDASFPYDVREHGIEIPSYMGVTIAPEMTARVDVVLKP